MAAETAGTVPPSGFTPPSGALNLPTMAMSGNESDPSSDESLMLAWAAGDPMAFERLYDRHRLGLYRYLLRQLRNSATVEDLYQDVWQRVIAARTDWTPDARFATWLYRIAHNRLVDHWRALPYRPAAPADGEDRVARIPDADTPERTLSAFEDRRRLQQALETLPHDQREVLMLRLERELTLEQIGEITGVGRETVKSRLRYAMDKLRTQLAEPAIDAVERK